MKESRALQTRAAAQPSRRGPHRRCTLHSAGWPCFRASVSYKVFLSHSHLDRPLVEGIKSQIEAIGISVYLYEEDSQPGQHLGEKLQGAIAASDALVVLLTSHSTASGYVNQEVGYALGRNKPVLPLVAPGVDPGALAMLEGHEFLRMDPTAPLDGSTALLHYLHRRRELRDQQDLVVALALIGILLLMAWSSQQART